jgi:hypothetical protein
MVADLVERLCLDLSDALTSNAEHFAYFLESVLYAV